jgi:YidC/Oxa1 family membrane protein insertase
MSVPLAIPVLHELEQGLTWLLEWLHATDWLWPGAGGVPWAWAIVATTIIVRTILLPLTVRQIHSMQRLQAHAPEMKAIQQRYKQDRAKQQEELMKFYRENKINPASSCLPILFQIPVFLALFFVLRDFDTEVLAKPKYAGTDSLTDLGWLNIVPDITQNLSEDTFSMVVLLILYATSQTASTYFMSATMDKMQRYLLLALPLIFLFFVINFPAGLMIYWVTTNLWTTGQGLVTRKLRPKPVPPEKRSSRTAPGTSGDGKPKVEPAAPPAAASAPPRRVKKKKKRTRR